MSQEEEILEFLTRSNYGMTATEVARNFRMRHEKAKKILTRMIEENLVKLTTIGNTYLYKKNI